MTDTLPVTLTRLVVDVVGGPAPQGSKRHVGNGVMVESSKLVKPWRQDVAAAVIAEMAATGWRALTGPVTVTVVFYLRRPVSAPKSRTMPDRRPDLDKCLRSTCDALVTAGAVEDDARIVKITAEKRYAVAGVATGATITIEAAT